MLVPQNHLQPPLMAQVSSLRVFNYVALYESVREPGLCEFCRLLRMMEILSLTSLLDDVMGKKAKRKKAERRQRILKR